MAEYYLISQLPSLDGLSENSPISINEEQFFELCSRFLSKKSLNELKKTTLIPPKDYEKSSSLLVTKWNEGERNLRLALEKLRAEKMNVSSDIQTQSFPTAILQAARTAIEFESPMEAEKFLNNWRLAFLESLRPMDTFSEEFVFYYALKLKLIERMRKFDSQRGEIAYRKIYDSIMSEDKTEVIQ
jgi:hypothetical protein